MRGRLGSVAWQAQGGCGVPDVEPRHHRLKEGRLLLVVDVDHPDDFVGFGCSRVLPDYVVKVLLLVLGSGPWNDRSVAPLGLVHRGDVVIHVKARQAGGGVEDARGLAAVVLVVRVVSTTERVQPIVNGEVPDVVVPCHHLAEIALVVLDVVLQAGDSVVDVHQFAHVEGFCQESPAERQSRVGAVQTGRYVVEVLDQVAGVPVVVD